jgi:hypothetical protein
MCTCDVFDLTASSHDSYRDDPRASSRLPDHPPRLVPVIAGSAHGGHSGDAEMRWVSRFQRRRSVLVGVLVSR